MSHIIRDQIATLLDEYEIDKEECAIIMETLYVMEIESKDALTETLQRVYDNVIELVTKKGFDINNGKVY